MANTYKNIVITPNTGSVTGDPTIVFSGGNTTVNTDVTLRVYPDSNGTLSFEGAAGQLFSITNDLSNSIFAVNDVTGMPLIEVNVSSQQITLGEFYGNVGVGKSSSTSSIYKLDVNGTINASNVLINGSPITGVANLTPANGYVNTSTTAANNYAGAMANAANGYATTINDANLIVARAYTNTSTGAANNYAGAMANSGNAWTQTIVDANLVTARAYTNTSTTAANNYAGAMANSANSGTGTSANNYAGVMANSVNAYANTLGTNTSLAYSWTNNHTFSANVFYRNTSNLVWITNSASAVSNVTLRNYPDSNGTLSFEGSAGQLFSITNDLSGSIFAVNDVTGMPLVEVNVTSQQVTFGQFYGNVGIGTNASTASIYKLDVAGTANISSPTLLVAGQNVIASFASGNSYAGAMANSGNAITYAVVSANLDTARAYTNTSTTAANNYAGAMANSANAIATATFGTITNTAAAFAKANSALANTSGVSFNGNLFFPTGNVGIGTTSSSTRLQVGTKVTDDASYTYDANTFMVVHQAPTSTTTLNDPKSVMMLARQGTGGQAYGAAASFDLSRYENAGTSSVGSRTRLDITLANNNFIAQNTTVMTLLSGGRVGIGTTSPSTFLEVSSGASQYPVTVNLLPSTHASSRRASIAIADWYVLQDIFGVGTKDFSIYNSSGFHGLTITTAGNVGVGGTTAAGYKLQVVGASSSAQIYASSTDASMSRIGLTNSNRHWTISNYGTSFSPNGRFAIADETAGAVRLTIDTDGSVTSLSNHKAPIYYDSDNTAYYIDAAGYSRTSSILSDNLRILNGGTFIWQHDSAGANNKYWDTYSDSGGTLYFRAVNDPYTAATTWLNVTRSGQTPQVITLGGTYTTAAGSLRAPIFYDSDDTSTYLNPSGTSVLGSVIMSNMRPYVDGWHTSYGDSKNRFYFANNARTYFGSQDGYEFRSATDTNIGSIDNSGNMIIAGNIRVNAIVENSTTIAANYTITANYNAMSAGPITINSGVTVTVPSGSTWTVV